MNLQDAYWEHGLHPDVVCDNCEQPAISVCFDEPGSFGIVLRARCTTHYNRDTQGKWLKNLKKKDLGTRN